jgi:large subunit ribosomal protein L24
MAAKLKKGDKVVVLAGKDKGKKGEITQVMPKDNKAVVDGVNIAIRHTKQSPRRARAAACPPPMPIDLSNLALVDGKNGKATRVGFRIEDGKKVRFRQDHRGGDLMLDAATYTPRLKAHYATVVPRSRKSSATRTTCRSRGSTRSC